MPEETDRQAIVDEEHLRLVSYGYLISAVFAAFYACFGLLYLLMGIAMGIGFSHIPAGSGGGNDVPPAVIGWIFGAIGLVFSLLAGGMAFLRFWAAKCVKRRKSRTFCMVIAGIGCLEIPYGTAISVLTLIVLSRDSITRLFNSHARQESPVA